MRGRERSFREIISPLKFGKPASLNDFEKTRNFFKWIFGKKCCLKFLPIPPKEFLKWLRMKKITYSQGNWGGGEELIIFEYNPILFTSPPPELWLTGLDFLKLHVLIRSPALYDFWKMRSTRNNKKIFFNFSNLQPLWNMT